jgi:integrase
MSLRHPSACPAERRWYVFILVLLHTGCRRGEVLGLKWPDIDFENKRIRIRRGWVHGRTSTPKARKRRDRAREVAITPAMELSLRGLRTFRDRDSRSWVFHTRTGRPVDGTTIQRVWDRMRGHMAEEGIPQYTLHSLRHTFATLSLLGGKSIMWVSRQLGHKSVKARWTSTATFYRARKSTFPTCRLLVPALTGTQPAPVLHSDESRGL